MKGFEWLQEVPDVHRKITPTQFKRFPGKPLHYQQSDTLIQAIARYAVLSGNKTMLRFAFDKGLRVDSKTTRQLARHDFGDCLLIFIDVGVTDQTNLALDCHWFNKTRLCARSSAILTMYAMKEMDKKYKNVSKIIGRVIWESRGDCENWLRQGRLLKK